MSHDCPSKLILAALLVDQLDEHDSDIITLHIEGCPYCQQALDELTHTPDVLSFRDAWRRREGREIPIDGAGGLAVRVEPSEPRETRAARTQLGRFQIKEQLGAGSFGIVYLAWDTLLKRHVALKIPRDVALVDDDLRTRFLREVEATAKLHHPHIVPLHDAGEHDGVCYLAAEYCAGGSLVKWRNEHPQPMLSRPAARVVAALADAVEHAHRRGVLHRDIKPSNILVEPAADSDDAPFTPKLTDFGLAKIVGSDAGQTNQGVMLGTPQYMAPEQADPSFGPITAATDIYALGVILFELVAGRRPIDDEDQSQMLHQLVRRQPGALRSLQPAAPRDLEAICAKCLEKEPAMRYRSAAELSADLERFLSGQPTLARPLSTWQRALKWSRRRPALATLAGVVMLAVLGISSLGAWHATQLNAKNQQLRVAVDEARQQRDLVVEGDLQARRVAYGGLMEKRAGELWNRGQTGLLAELLTNLRPDPGEEDLRGFAWHYLWRQTHKERFLRGHSHNVHAVAFSPDGRLCASGSNDGIVKLWNVATGKLIASLEGHSLRSLSVAFSPDGKHVASAGYVEEPSVRCEVKLWDVARVQPLADLTGPMTFVYAVAFTPDGRSLAMAGSMANDQLGVVRLHDLTTGQGRNLLESPLSYYTCLAVSVGSRKLAALCRRTSNDITTCDIRWWDFTTGEMKVLTSSDEHVIQGLAISPDGQFIATGSDDKIARLWDVRAGNESVLFKVERATIHSLAFSPDGRILTTGHNFEAGTSKVRWWDVRRGVSLSQRPELNCGLSGFAYASDGNTLALACSDNLVRLWNLRDEPDFFMLPGHLPEAWAVAFSPDGRTLASAGDDHTIRLWDPATGHERATLNGHGSLVTHVAFSPDGRWLASASYDQTVKLWDADTGKVQATFQDTQPVRCVAFSPDGRTLASGGKDRVVKLWDLPTRRERLQLLGHENQVRCLAFAADGRTLVSASEDRTIRFWDTATGEQLRQLDETSEVWSLAISPDGKMLASGNKDSIIKLWDVATGKQPSVLRGHMNGVRSLAFTADGRTLASGSADRTIRLWQPSTGHELLCLKDQSHEVNSVSFSQDGQMLAAALHDGAVRLWHAPILPGN